MEQLYKDLLNSFGLKADSCLIKPLEQGHIHATYLVYQCGENHPPLILQEINTYVFKDVELLMRNLEIVTNHIAYKNRKAGKNPAKTGIFLLEAEGGKSWTGNDETGYWRMFWYIENQESFEVAENVDLAFQGGKAIAEFQEMLIDLDPDSIADSIPGFHDIRMRVDQFNEAICIASAERSKKAEELILFARENLDHVVELFNISEGGNIPTRLTHNDTKFNNILFGKDGQLTCMIDLDTVMKGYSWFDFGDALRTCASMAPEDEADPGKIGFRLEIFEGFAKGYLSEASNFLTADEISILHRAPGFFAYMQGLRFLTDYLNGDVYYKTSFPEHNFQRARAQFTLMQRMTEKQARMKEIIQLEAGKQMGK